MRIILNGKEADTGLDTRPITRADYDALSSSDKNLDVLYLVDNSVTRMTKSREAEFEWFSPRDPNNSIITAFPPISFSDEGGNIVTKLFRESSSVSGGCTFFISFGYRTAFRALRFQSNLLRNTPATVTVCFSDNMEDWSEDVVCYPTESPGIEDVVSNDYYFPNEMVFVTRFAKVSISGETSGSSSSVARLMELLISPQQDSEGSSGESYSRYVLYYHDTPLWRSEETIGESVVIDDQERLIGTWFGDPLYEIGITTYCYTSTTSVGSYGAIAPDFKIYGVDHVVELIGVVQNPANFNYNQRIEVPIPNSQCKVFPQFNFDSTGKTWISLCEQHSDSLYDSKPVRLRIRYTKQASS